MAPTARTIRDNITGTIHCEICMDGIWNPARMLDDLSQVQDKYTMSFPIRAEECRSVLDEIIAQFVSEKKKTSTGTAGILPRIGVVPHLLSLALCAPEDLRPEVFSLIRNELTCKRESMGLQVARILYESFTTYTNVHPRPIWLTPILAAIPNETAYNIRQNLLYYAGILAERSRPTQAYYLRELADPDGASSSDEERPAPDDEPAAKRSRCN